MNITSCENCGVVLDKDQLVFPEVWDDENGTYIDEAVYDPQIGEYIAVCPCPVCKTPIPEKE